MISKENKEITIAPTNLPEKSSGFKPTQKQMKKKWKPLCETPDMSIYQHRDTTVILTKEKATFQTSKKMRKVEKDLTNYLQDKHTS